jgi:hypothetical protein
VTEKLLLNITAAAKLLGVGERAVKAAIDSSQLRTVVLDKRRLIPRAAIEEIRSGAVHAVEHVEGEACDCARLAAEVLDG